MMFMLYIVGNSSWTWRVTHFTPSENELNKPSVIQYDCKYLGNKSLLKNEQAMQAHSLFAGAGMFIAGYC